MTTQLELSPISTSDTKMSLGQCNTEIAALQKQHHSAIEGFWAQLKKGLEPNSTWSKIQFDLHTVYLSKIRIDTGIDTPDADDMNKPWSQVMAQLIPENRSKIKARPLYGELLDLVAVISGGDELTLVHRYEGDRVYGIDEDGLSINNCEGPDWYYKSRSYESAGSAAAYSVPALYLIGSLDADTGDWTSKPVSDNERFRIESICEAMESLRDFNELPRGLWGTHLGDFPSGFQSRLAELELVRARLVERGMQTEAERAAVREAISPLRTSIEKLSKQIHQLEAELSIQRARCAEVGLESFLNFNGMQRDQQVTHTVSGETAVLRISGLQPRLWAQVGDQKPDRFGSDTRLHQQIRCGEWIASAESQDDGTGRHPVERQT